MSKETKKSLSSFYYSLIFMVIATIVIAATAVPTAFKNAVKRCESGGRYNIMGGTNGAYHGAYQFSRDHVNACISSGVCGKHGVSNSSQFLNSPAAQEAYFDYYALNLVNSLGQNKCGGSNPPLTSYIGKTIPGTNVKITEWGLMMAAHLGGPCGAERNLIRIMAGSEGSKDSMGTSIKKYLTIGSAVDLNTTGPNPQAGSCGDISTAGFINGSGGSFGPGEVNSSGSESAVDNDKKFMVENLPWYTGGDDMLSDKRYNELFKDDASCVK